MVNIRFSAEEVMMMLLTKLPKDVNFIIYIVLFSLSLLTASFNCHYSTFCVCVYCLLIFNFYIPEKYMLLIYFCLKHLKISPQFPFPIYQLTTFSYTLVFHMFIQANFYYTCHTLTQG